MKEELFYFFHIKIVCMQWDLHPFLIYAIGIYQVFVVAYLLGNNYIFKLMKFGLSIEVSRLQNNEIRAAYYYKIVSG